MTQNVFAALRAEIVSILKEMLPELPEDAFARVQVEPPREASHGDMATNAALIVAKPAKLPPPKVAAAIAEKLAALPMVESAAPAGPGFVNVKLKEEFWRAQLPVILKAGVAYGESAIGAGQKVNVEYVSANPTGPMHVGHCRGAVVGDALANLLAKAGYEVTKEYYINDAGAQVQMLARAAYWRYLEALGSPLTVDELAGIFGGEIQYRGEYLIPVGQALKEKFGDSLAPGVKPADPSLWQDTVREFTVAAMMAEIREDLAALGVEQDVFLSEKGLVERNAVAEALNLLDGKGLIYEGVLEPPKGKTPEDWEPRPQTLFRSTDFGDDVDRPLRKSDGSNTYFANDIACHADKISRGFDHLIDVWGADHGGYVKRMQAAVKAVSDSRVPLEVVLCQIVHVLKDGQPVRMSKRAGSYITLRDLIDEVGKDAVRFTMLTRKSDAQMEFDLTKVVEQSRDNPVFYVQYAHARCRSVLRTAGDPSIEELAAAPLDVLSGAGEMALIRRLAAWPRLLESAATAREPHRVAFFLQDVASDFHVVWTEGRADSSLRFIQADDPVATKARMALVAATASVIRAGLAVMGVAPVEEMR
ncbi:arginine--tRNA ligase [Acetobacteraceae bacterium H6797]|nr:arginine--tRNA ligase [Acetobacteraceae bacterium H6797]